MDSIKPEPLPNVHECLADAAKEHRDLPAMVGGTFKVPKEVKKLTQQICKQNGTDMSAFLRQCCVNLCKGYVDPA